MAFVPHCNTLSVLRRSCWQSYKVSSWYNDLLHTQLHAVCMQMHTDSHTHARTHAHMHARTCAHLHTHICMHERTHMHAWAHTCMHTCTHAGICTHMRMHAHTGTYTHANTCMYVRTHTRARTHTSKNILKAAQVYALGEVPSTISPSLCQTLCCQTSVASRVMQRLGKVAWADGWLVSQFSRLHPGLAIGHCEACEPSESRSRNSPQRIRLKLLLPIWSLGGCWWFHPITVIRTETKRRDTSGAGISQWLERRTCDWKVAGSNPCWGGGSIFFSRVDFLCWLLFRYPFHPCVTAAARKRSRSFCQMCRWQVTAKPAYTLRMWLCMKWHGAWLCGVHRTCTEMAADSCGTSHASTVSTPLQWIFKKRAIKLVTHVEPHASAVSLLKRAENSAI